MGELTIKALDELQAREPDWTSTTSDGAHTRTERFYEISEAERDSLLAMARRCIDHESDAAWQAARDRLDTAIQDQHAAESRVSVLSGYLEGARQRFCPTCTDKDSCHACPIADDGEGT